MSKYPGPSLATLLRTNQQVYLVGGPGQGENVAVGYSSIAYELERIKSSYYPFGASAEIWFSGTPGAFEVDLQTADLDIDSHYVTISQLTGGLNSSNVGRIELAAFWAKYIRAHVTALANPVLLSVLLTR